MYRSNKRTNLQNPRKKIQETGSEIESKRRLTHLFRGGEVPAARRLPLELPPAHDQEARIEDGTTMKASPIDLWRQWNEWLSRSLAPVASAVTL